jgi:hypothetical protein
MKKTKKKTMAERFKEMAEEETLINLRLTTDELTKLNALARNR